LESDPVEELVLVPQDRFSAQYPNPTPQMLAMIERLREREREKAEQEMYEHQNRQNEQIERILNPQQHPPVELLDLDNIELDDLLPQSNPQTGGNTFKTDNMNNPPSSSSQIKNNDLNMRHTTGRPKGAKNKGVTIKERLIRAIQIASKLSLIKAYNYEGNILNKNGQYDPETNIYKLIELALQPTRRVKGIHDFIRLLKQANIDSNLIVNESIKNLLENFNKNNELTSSQFDPALIPLPQSPPPFSSSQRKRKNIQDLSEKIDKIPKNNPINWDQNGNE